MILTTAQKRYQKRGWKDVALGSQSNAKRLLIDVHHRIDDDFL
jgi:hypothetical protein